MTNENKEALRNHFRVAFAKFNALRVEGGMEVVSMAAFTEQVRKAIVLAIPADGSEYFAGSKISPEDWTIHAQTQVLELAYDIHGDELGMADAERNEI